MIGPIACPVCVQDSEKNVKSPLFQAGLLILRRGNPGTDGMLPRANKMGGLGGRPKLSLVETTRFAPYN
jgi:hypothetical protein